MFFSSREMGRSSCSCTGFRIPRTRRVELEPADFMKEPIRVPTLAFAGLTDLIAPEVYVQGKWMFANEYRVECLPGGHFMHRESPEQFAKALLEFLKEG